MLKDLFREQKESIDTFFADIDIAQAEEFFELCLQCRGLIICTGIGKSGIIAEKIAATMTSTGTKALYLPPINFLHGDIGILSNEDILLVLSKSGETEELSDFTMLLPLKKELCPYDLAPTTSTEIQLIFGDILAVALMQAKSFSLGDYAQTHPLGTIGKKTTLTVNDLMLQDDQLPLCGEQDRLVDVLVELSNKKCGCLFIVDSKRHLKGIFTDGDLRRALQSHGSAVLEKPVGNFMTRSPTVLKHGLLAWDALKMMQHDPKKWVMVCPVLEGNKIVGVLRMHDIIQAGLS
jgi:arabinose-5-phosphate isomerase